MHIGTIQSILLTLNPKFDNFILPMEEKDLIVKAQAGDRKALAELVRKYEQTIMGSL